MRVFIDTNILISCIIWPDRKPAQAFFKAAYGDGNKAIVCEYSIDELHRVFRKKFSGLMHDMISFLAIHMPALEVVPVTSEPCESEQLIRDENDRPILRAAINARADILLTGDKDFLDSGIPHPRIMNASEFLELD